MTPCEKFGSYLQRFLSLAAFLSLLSLANNASAQTWNEFAHGSTDAGDSITDFQIVSSAVCDNLGRISGVIDTPRDNDLFLIEISDPANFSANTACPSCDLDTQIGLFHETGKPIYFNDDASLGSKGSVLPSNALVQNIPRGRYLLWVSVFGNYPIDENGRVLFGYTAPPGLTKVWARQPGVKTLAGYHQTPDARQQGVYEVELTGASCVLPNNEPIELQSEKRNNQIVLRWMSSDNVEVTVEARTSSAEEFESVAVSRPDESESRTRTLVLPQLDPGSYEIRLAYVVDGRAKYSNTTAVEFELPRTHSMSKIYPNPFNPEATFELTVSMRQQVVVEMYNMVGQHVLLIADSYFEADVPTKVRIDGRTVPSGAYIVTVNGATFSESRVVNIIK